MFKKVYKCSTLPGEWLFIDISLATTATLGGNQHCLLIVDYCTDCAWSYFLEEKSEMPDKVDKLVKEVKIQYSS